MTLVFGNRFHFRDHIVKALHPHLDRIEDRTFDLLLQRRLAAVPELEHVEQRVQNSRRVALSERV